MPNKPTHIVYHVRDFTGEDGDKRSVWTRVGAGWTNKDAKGMSLVLDLLPADGRLWYARRYKRESRPRRRARRSGEPGVRLLC